MKLYRVEYSYTVEGLRKQFLSKKMRPVSAKVDSRIRYIICEKEDVENEVKKIIKDKIEEWQKEINSCGYTWLYDWTLAFIPETKFNQIERCTNIEIYYEEATIEECIERLSPTEYNEMYGNILKVVKNND
jgi:hypothetical protein